jgi:hypothetical protein
MSGFEAVCAGEHRGFRGRNLEHSPPGRHRAVPQRQAQRRRRHEQVGDARHRLFPLGPVEMHPDPRREDQIVALATRMNLVKRRQAVVDPRDGAAVPSLTERAQLRGRLDRDGAVSSPCQCGGVAAGSRADVQDAPARRWNQMEDVTVHVVERKAFIENGEGRRVLGVAVGASGNHRIAAASMALMPTAQIVHGCIGARASPALARRLARRMAGVAALVGVPRIHDGGFGPFSLDAQGGDQRIFGVDDDVVALAIELESDGKSHGAPLGSVAVRRDHAGNALILWQPPCLPGRVPAVICL